MFHRFLILLFQAHFFGIVILENILPLTNTHAHFFALCRVTQMILLSLVTRRRYRIVRAYGADRPVFAEAIFAYILDRQYDIQ